MCTGYVWLQCGVFRLPEGQSGPWISNLISCTRWFPHQSNKLARLKMQLIYKYCPSPLLAILKLEIHVNAFYAYCAGFPFQSSAIPETTFSVFPAVIYINGLIAITIYPFMRNQTFLLHCSQKRENLIEKTKLPI